MLQTHEKRFEPKMNVFYFSSDAFVSVAATSIASLMENNKEFEEITFYIIDDGITETNKGKLTDQIEAYSRKVRYIPAPDPSELFDFPFMDRYQMGHSYVRMAIGTLMPQDVDRVLALDSDTLVAGSLSELWNTDMCGNILAGVTDCLNLKAYRKQFGLINDEFYCNAGVYLVDLKRWREENIEERIRQTIKQRNGNVFFFEQTLMNYACKNQILMLHPKYNVYTLFYAFTYKNLMLWRRPTVFYSECEVEEAKRHPRIIHFTRNFYMKSRPWVSGCDHPLTEMYCNYKQLTPWQTIEEDNRTTVGEWKYRLWHLLPQRVVAMAASFIYNVIRPKMWWKNE